MTFQENKNIAISNIIFDKKVINNQININDFIITKIEMVDNYKMKLSLKNDNGIFAKAYITAVDSTVQGRNILAKLIFNQNIIGVPLGVLPRLDMDYKLNKNYF